MKLYKIKDAFAILWFLILILLQHYKYYKLVTIFLLSSLLTDLVFTITDIGAYSV